MDKKKKGNSASKGAANRPLYSRISFLYQAASLLSVRQIERTNSLESSERNTPHKPTTTANTFSTPKPDPDSALSRHLISQMTAVSLKTQIRLSPAIKRSICKTCSTILIPGHTSTIEIQNPSRGGKKPWADVLVQKCCMCGAEKRFPIGAMRQKRSPGRLKAPEADGVDGGCREGDGDGDEDNVDGYMLWSDGKDVAIPG
ncbi:MAG: hypothetical protein M1829_000314 [Trizodia sp. TS-e1964]|nr:MAG: hypothetical protein M1829_000314 [Trizodia sp. TS-e1964]